MDAKAGQACIATKQDDVGAKEAQCCLQRKIEVFGTEYFDEALHSRESVNEMVGRKVLKPMGADSVRSGYVRCHVPASPAGDDAWVLHWDAAEVADEVVSRAILDKFLNLQAVSEREFRTQAKVKAKGEHTAPKEDTSRGNTDSPKKAGSGASAKTKVIKSPRSGEKRAMSKALRRSPGPHKRIKSTRVEPNSLRGNGADVGTCVAKLFQGQLFTGVVAKVSKSPPMFWGIEYEDGDAEDLDERGVTACVALCKKLQKRFANSLGRPATPEDAARERGEGEDEAEVMNGANGKGKGKGKAGTSAQEAKPRDPHGLVGSYVRKMFDVPGKNYSDAFDGKVVQYLEDDGEDGLGELWLVVYSDGDQEHLNESEVREAKGRFDKDSALIRVEVNIPTKLAESGVRDPRLAGLLPQKSSCVLYSEHPLNSRLFTQIKYYRSWKEASWIAPPPASE